MRRVARHPRTAALLAFALCGVAAGSAIALDCISSNAEYVEYELAEVRIDGEVVDGSEFGTKLHVQGSNIDGEAFSRVESGDGELVSELAFGRGGQQ